MALPLLPECTDYRREPLRLAFFFFFLRFIYYIYYIEVHCSCLQTHQKRASDLITDGYEPPCGCWDLNSGPLEEQSVLLTTEPSLQPPQNLFLMMVLKRFNRPCSPLPTRGSRKERIRGSGAIEKDSPEQFLSVLSGSRQCRSQVSSDS